MRKLFKAVRWLASMIILLILFIFITLSIPLSSISSSVTNRETIKTWVLISGIYENAQEIALEFISTMPKEESEEKNAGQEDKKANNGNEPSPENFFSGIEDELKDPDSDMSRLVNKIAYPEKLQTVAETIIDAVYDWLEGKKDRIVFSISLVEREDFEEFVTFAFKQKLDSLPVCGAEFIPPKDFNPMEAECWPEELQTSVLDQFIEENSERQEFEELYESTTINSDKIQTPEGTTRQVQYFFKIARTFPVLSIAFALLLIGILLIIIPNRALGAIASGGLLVIESLIWGTFILVADLKGETIYRFFPGDLEISAYPITKQILDKLIMSIFETLTSKIFSEVLIVALVGILIIIVGTVMKKARRSE